MANGRQVQLDGDTQAPACYSTEKQLFGNRAPNTLNQQEKKKRLRCPHYKELIRLR